MKHNKTIMSLFVVFFGLGGLQAQEAVPASGGDATGAGGSSSYTVGQAVYTTNTGTNSSVAQGVQQPFEISITTGINIESINLDLSVYPNPTTDFLTLKTENSENISYQLFNLEGKLIEDKKVNTNNTSIKMVELPKTIYFLKVAKNNQIVKTFKIIKN
ncbi:MAG: hypothetical protein ACI8RY_000214 [Urechidicola sp.]|jgi:hypothetical protein|tara:strand:+ start:123 stop:599 length:477 start_codon:yes stop_codon:yes gene_type:complete